MPRLRSALALWAAASLAVAAPPPPQGGLRYGSGMNSLDPVARLSDAQLAQQLSDFLARVNVTQFERAGTPPTVLWKSGASAVGELSRTERIAVLATLQRVGAQGAESDLLVPQPDGSRVPVTVYFELSGVVSFSAGQPIKALLTPGSDADTIAQKYALDPFTEDGAKWTPEQLAAVERALSLLTPDELSCLKGLGFRRKRQDNAGRSAYYRRADDGATIDVFDKTFESDGDTFVGPLDAPASRSVGTLLHEAAHAMSDFQGRQKALAANAAVAAARAAQDAMKADPSADNKKVAKEKTEAARALRGTQNAQDKVMLQKGRAAERAFAAVVDPKTSVTTYGRTSLDENLAEAFLLSKLDPAALARVAPPAIDFFKAGTLAKEAQKPLE